MAEIIEKRGRNSKTFELGGGKYRFEVGNHPHTFKAGLWLPVDTTIESETGYDADTGLNYIARSRFESLDYDIRFGKNDPVWMKIKHLPTNKTLTFKPRQNNNNPTHNIVGNKIFVSQVWDGIDMEIFVSDLGVKTNYIITSSAGQRVIEFNISGDLAAFKVADPWYEVAGVVVTPPKALNGNVLSYDFRNVPLGTKIDPTIQISEASTLYVYSLVNTNPDWSVLIAEASSDSATLVTTGTVRIARIVGPTFSASRGYFAIDTSALDDGLNVVSASLFVTPSTLSPAAESVVVQKSTNTNDDANTGTWDEADAGVVGAAVSIVGATVDTEITLEVPTAAISLTGTTKLLTRNYEHDFLVSAPSSETQRFYAYGPADTTVSKRPHLSVTYAVGSSVSFGAKTQYPFARRHSWR